MDAPTWPPGRLLLLVCALVLHFRRALPGKILLLPPMVPSHVIELCELGSELVAWNHTVHIVMKSSATLPPRIRHSGIKIIPYTTKDNADPFRDDPFKTSADSSYNGRMASPGGLLRKMKQFDIFSRRECESVLGNDNLYATLKSHQFDIVIVGGFAVTSCLYVIPHRLGVPYGTVTAMTWTYISFIQSLSSISPTRHTEFTDRMSFIERLRNLFHSRLGSALTSSYFDTAEYNRYTPDRPYTSLVSLAQQSKFWFLNMDGIMDYPVPRMPNVFYVGGLVTRQANLVGIPDDLLRFADGAHHGLIIASFGTTIAHIPNATVRVFLDSFRRIPQRVIWKYLEPIDCAVPDNVLIRKWIPQNDLLGHRNTRLFITHCGSNGQYEALFHGVPMLGFPFTADQPYNARRMTKKGFGLRMDMASTSSDELVNNINELITNVTFKNNIQKASAIFRDFQHPRQRAAFWVNHIMKYGAEHLTSEARHLAWYQVLMLDVMVAILAAVVVILYCLYTCAKLLWRHCGHVTLKVKAE